MKTKLRWEFPPTIFTTTVLPSELARTHQETTRPLVLHNCLYGYNEQGTLVKTLYCTHSGRFFTHDKDGWHEQLPCTNRVRRGKKNKSPKSGGSFDTAYMSNFGKAKCYRLIAYAFCEWPEEAKTDPLWYKHFEVDHLNGDHNDHSPENLRWLKPEQNRAWDKRCGRKNPKTGKYQPCSLRGIGLDPKRIYYHHLRAISDLTDPQFVAFLQHVQEVFANDPSALSIDAINADIRQALNDLTA